MHVFFKRNKSSDFSLDVPQYFIKSNVICLINLKTSNDNNNPGWAIVMQEKGCSGFLRLVMDLVSILLLV